MSDESLPILRRTVHRYELELLSSKAGLNIEQVKFLDREVFHTEFLTSFQSSLLPTIRSLEGLRKILSPILPDAPSLMDELTELLQPKTDLQVPHEILRLITNGEKVAFFVGAGLSRDFKLPGWEELGRDAMDLIGEHWNLKGSVKDLLDGEKLGPKQKLSMFEEIVGKENPEQVSKFYEEKLRPRKEVPNDQNGYFHICRIKNVIKVTTNADPVFEDAFKKASLTLGESNQLGGEQAEPGVMQEPQRVIVSETGYKGGLLSSDAIYYLHGHHKHPSSLVMGQAAYIRAYFHENSPVGEFLRHLFSNYTVVFVAYGLEEMPVLESVLAKSKIRSHYHLLGITLAQAPILPFLQKYWKTLGVTLIPYLKDADSYQRLPKVLKAWADEIQKREVSLDFYAVKSEIDRVLING